MNVTWILIGQRVRCQLYFNLFCLCSDYYTKIENFSALSKVVICGRICATLHKNLSYNFATVICRDITNKSNWHLQHTTLYGSEGWLKMYYCTYKNHSFDFNIWRQASTQNTFALVAGVLSSYDINIKYEGKPHSEYLRSGCRHFKALFVGVKE